jgi:hypothetical protein
VPVGILFAFLFFICFIDSLFHFGGFGFFFQLFLQLLVSGRAIFIADADPAMSSEVLGGLPRAQAIARALERADNQDSAKE